MSLAKFFKENFLEVGKLLDIRVSSHFLTKVCKSTPFIQKASVEYG